MTWILAERLAGTGVVANAVDPGVVKTGFLSKASGFAAWLMAMSVKIIGVTPEQGAATPPWAATAPELATVTGRFFAGRREKDGKHRDKAALDRLEAIVDEMVGRARASSNAA